MPSDLAALQGVLVRAVHGDPAAFAATEALVRPAAIAAGKRLYLHLNTVDHALTAVLRQAYPATARLLGDASFAQAARGFLRARPPDRPVLSGYGAGFERYLVETAALAEPLVGVARLDWAAQEAYVAADAEALSAADLAALPEARHAALVLPLVPSARLLPLAAAAWHRWAALADPQAVALAAPPAGGEPAGALVWRRPDLLLAARPLSAAERDCLAALAAGASLLEAAAAAADPAFDLAALLTDALAGGLFRAGPGAPS